MQKSIEEGCVGGCLLYFQCSIAVYCIVESLRANGGECVSEIEMASTVRGGRGMQHHQCVLDSAYGFAAAAHTMLYGIV